MRVSDFKSVGVHSIFLFLNLRVTYQAAFLKQNDTPDDTSVPTECHLNATGYLSIVADHVRPFQHEHDTDFTVLKRARHSPGLNPTEHLWNVVERAILIVNVQLTNVWYRHVNMDQNVPGIFPAPWMKWLMGLCLRICRTKKLWPF